MNTIKTAEQVIEQMVREIKADINSGTVPATIASFSELHDYVDANEYGSFCDDKFADKMIAYFGGRDEHEGMPQGFIDFMNYCQNVVDSMLQAKLI